MGCPPHRIPQALHSGVPFSAARHNGVRWVLQEAQLRGGGPKGGRNKVRGGTAGLCPLASSPS